MAWYDGRLADKRGIVAVRVAPGLDLPFVTIGGITVRKKQPHSQISPTCCRRNLQPRFIEVLPHWSEHNVT